jgi:ribulose-phosphate 3-epimerase
VTPGRTGAPSTSRSGRRAAAATPFEALAPYLDRVDLVLCMTVFPGFGGQSFMAEVMPKVRQVRDAVASDGLDVRVEVDGGIDERTVVQAAGAGADVFVAGSAVFGRPHPLDAVRAILGAAREAVGQEVASGEGSTGRTGDRAASAPGPDRS